MLEALLNSRTSQGLIPLSDCTYILDSGVVKRPLVGRSNLPYKREIYKGESHTKLLREAMLNVRLILIPSWLYDSS
jgi:hypothetical protein